MAESPSSAKSSYNPLDDPEELRVLHAALDSFRQYRRAAHFNITHLRRQAFYSLPSAQVEVLSSPPFSLTATFNAVDAAIDANADIADAIVTYGAAAFGIDPEDKSWHGKATPHDVEKAESTVRQIYRDWTAEGLPERHASHSPIIKSLEAYVLPLAHGRRDHIKVLVPGAGLARLVVDICAAGYCVEGNEISYHQLLASNYLLNFIQEPGQHTLYPWASTFSNHRSRQDQLRAYAVPDMTPASILEAASQTHPDALHYSERMGMSSGDFCVLYGKEEYKHHFDAVATCFFIDTAPNVIKYIEAVHNCLKPGGYWINLGPLLWHFESAQTPAEREQQKSGGNPSHSSQQVSAGTNNGIGEPGSFQLTHEELLSLLAKFGFHVDEASEFLSTGYIQNPDSMLQNVYRPVHWVAHKVR